MTSDTLWELRELPARLVILGGGPIGCELGQAFARLGGAATIAEIADRLLPQADPAAGALIADALVRDGVDVRTAARAVAVANDRLTVVGPGGATTPLAFDRLLVAAGRSLRTAGLGPRPRRRGDRRPRLRGRRRPHAHGSLVVTNALFRLRRTISEDQIPWAVFTDPEVAHVGLTEAAARQRWGDAAIVVRHDHSRVDRAATEAHAVGVATLVGDPKERLVGATIVAEAAGESTASSRGCRSTSSVTARDSASSSCTSSRRCPFLALLLSAWDDDVATREETAAVHGAGPVATVWLVVLPAVCGPLVVGSLVVAAFVLGSFEVPLVMGPTQPETIATYALAVTQVAALSGRAEAAAALLVATAGALLLAIAAGVLLWRRRA